MRVVLFISFLLFTVAAQAQTEQEYPAYYYRSLGIVNYYERSFLAAAKALQHALQLQPGDKEANAMLSLVYDSLGSKTLSQKMKVRTQALNLSFGKQKDSKLPGIKNDLRTIGNDYYNRSVYDSAIMAYKLHLQTNSDDTAALFYLANSYFFLRNFNDAAQHYEKLLAIDKQRADVYNLAGVCYRNMDNILKARDYFKQCLINDSLFAVAYYNLGSAQYALEDFKQAEINLDKAATMLPNNREVLTLLAKLYMETRQKENALNAYERLYSINMSSEIANVMLGQLYFDAKDFEKCVFHLNNALSTVKTNVELKNLLGLAYLHLKKNDLAFELLKPAADILTDKKETQIAAAKAANNLKHYKEAGEYANRALALDKDCHPAMLELATALKGLKKNSAAKKVLKQAKR
ncbi:MAG: tetratricopeptide repeat protein [Chitinophagales bacterium]|nr:tetratricopeptide repeat protein [Chitinophagales bacterium]